jgi:anti-sigma factor ChrR (cupin superfamily)
VDRILLDRIGGETARATSIVRYAPGSYFSPHIHSGGEEFVVLEGVFQDEHGDYPVGSYVRNPPQSSHQPKSEKGCTIFVKLWQFEPNDRLTINIPVWPSATKTNSSENILYKDEFEHVACIQLPSTKSLTYTKHDGLEILVLAGSVTIEAIGDNLTTSLQARTTLNKHGWHRRPIGDSCIISGVGETDNTETPLIWIKTNHLTQIDDQIKRVLQA